MPDTVSWIESDANIGDLLTDEMRKQVCRDDGTLHRLYQALAPWPSAILPVHKFYQAILHAPDAPLDLNNGEFVATYVAILNKCTYARAHHGENFCATATSREDAQKVLDVLESGSLQSDILSDRQRAIAIYTRKLSLEPQAMVKGDIEALSDVGLRSAEIVHINQIAASFGYWTRMINGLGISLGEESIGLATDTLSEITKGQADE
ncbi:hypothetical protein [uncultured Roseovarius sp.]|uniref:hypothetical protein n=1 Tax=uncultured Roseovarius sp. TaxID=293344 RepID=UPI002638CB55|nr:hypothetical protein [uncultured Roseovarius sp.]